MKNEFKGDIKGFPKEVVKKMLKRQVQQGYKKGISVFQSSKLSGFDWQSSKEGFDFWNEVIIYENFDLFFKRYPKKK